MSARKLRITFAPEAESDPLDVLSFTERRWESAQRRAYERQFSAAIAQLGSFPALGRQRPEYGPGIRSHRVGQHVVIYQTSGNVLTMVRVLHARHDADSAFE